MRFMTYDDGHEVDWVDLPLNESWADLSWADLMEMMKASQTTMEGGQPYIITTAANRDAYARALAQQTQWIPATNPEHTQIMFRGMPIYADNTAPPDTVYMLQNQGPLRQGGLTNRDDEPRQGDRGLQGLGELIGDVAAGAFAGTYRAITRETVPFWRNRRDNE